MTESANLLPQCSSLSILLGNWAEHGAKHTPGSIFKFHRSPISTFMFCSWLCPVRAPRGLWWAADVLIASPIGRNAPSETVEETLCDKS